MFCRFRRRRLSCPQRRNCRKAHSRHKGHSCRFSDFIMRNLNEAGALSKDDVLNLALKDGYFADAESADRGVQAALVILHRNEHIRQLQDGSFAPPALSQTISFRRAM